MMPYMTQYKSHKYDTSLLRTKSEGLHTDKQMHIKEMLITLPLLNITMHRATNK